MKELVCIVCPNSCKLSISENGEVTGARCPRGKKFATEELTCPKRTVCTTVATVFDDRSEEHTSELQSQCCISYAVFCCYNRFTIPSVYVPSAVNILFFNI